MFFSTVKIWGLIALVAPLSHAAPRHPGSRRALYFLDGDPNGASVVSLHVAEDGRLGGPKRTSTGGKGMIGVDAEGTPNTEDPVFTQDALIVHGNRLFTVNSGSNTVAMFHIPEHDPTSPVLIGKPVSSGGDVPTTIAYSEKNGLVCVANTGPKAGVQCFTTNPRCDRLQPVGHLMPLKVNQTSTPIVGPPNTVSDIVFNPSETFLLVSVKGDGTNPGYTYTYAVENGRVNPKAVVSRSDDLLVNFSVSFVDDSHAAVTDPSHGVTFVSVAEDLKVSSTKSITIPDQGAICWSVYSKTFDAVFLLDTMNPDVHALDPNTGKTKYIIQGKEEAAGNADSVIDRNWLYTLNVASGISVTELKSSNSCADGPEVVQFLDLSALGPRAAWTGLGIYVG